MVSIVILITFKAPVAAGGAGAVQFAYGAMRR
jgi:hypothetical protein